MSGVMNAFIVLEANRKGRCLSISRLVVFGAGEEVMLRLLVVHLIASGNLFVTFYFLSSAIVLPCANTYSLQFFVFVLFLFFCSLRQNSVWEDSSHLVFKKISQIAVGAVDYFMDRAPRSLLGLVLVRSAFDPISDITDPDTL